MVTIMEEFITTFGPYASYTLLVLLILILALFIRKE